MGERAGAATAAQDPDRWPIPADRDPAPDGYEHRWVVLPGDGWEVIDTADAKQCRYFEVGTRCPERSVARLNRRAWKASARPVWWHYCEQHLYGRILRDGQVWTCVLREIGEANRG